MTCGISLRDAHGGLRRWPGVSMLAKLAGGPSWRTTGYPGAFGNQTTGIDTLRQHAAFTAAGQTIGTRSARASPMPSAATPPRAGTPSRLPASSATRCGTIIPFLLTYLGVQARETSPGQEDGHGWGGLRVSFPAIAIHAAGQIFYLSDGRLPPPGLHRRRGRPAA